MWMLLLVRIPQSLSFLNKRLLLAVAQDPAADKLQSRLLMLIEKNRAFRKSETILYKEKKRMLNFFHFFNIKVLLVSILNIFLLYSSRVFIEKYNWISSISLYSHTRICSIEIQLPPQFSQRLRQLGVVQLWILVGQSSSCRLRPYHKSVHGTLHVSASSSTGARSYRK